MTDKTDDGQPQQVFVPVTATQATPQEDKPEGKEQGDKPKKTTKGDGVPVGQVAAGGIGATVLGSYALASAVGPWGWAAAPAAGAVAGAGYLAYRRKKASERSTKTTITRTRGSKTRGGGFAGFRGRSGSMPGAGKPGVSSTSAKRSGGLSSPVSGKSGAPGSKPGGKTAGGARGSTPPAGGKRAGGGLFGGKGSGGPTAGRKPGGGLLGGGRKGSGGGGTGKGTGGGLFGGGSKGTSGKSPRGASGRGGLFGTRPKTGGSGRGTLGGRRHGGTDPTTSTKKKGPGMTTQSRWGRARDAIGKGAGRLADATRRGARRTGDAADRKTGRRASTAYRAASKPKGLRARWEAARTALARKSGRPWVNRAFAAGAVGVAAVGAAGYRANQWARNRAEQNLSRYAPAEEPHTNPEATGSGTEPIPTTTPEPGTEQTQERPAPAATTPTKPTTTTGGNTMSGLPASQIAHDMAGAMARYEPADAYQVVPDSRQWSEVPTQVAMSVKAYADRLEGSRFPLNGAINDKLREFAQAVAATRSIAEELEPLMRKAHEDDLARQESPRGDESKWNI